MIEEFLWQILQFYLPILLYRIEEHDFDVHPKRTHPTIELLPPKLLAY